MHILHLINPYSSGSGTFDSRMQSLTMESMVEAKRFAKKHVQISLCYTYTDNVGRAAYNLKLSKNRANAVKSYLMKQGVKESSFVLTPHGLSDPAASNASKEGRRLNRRVEIRLVIR